MTSKISPQNSNVKNRIEFKKVKVKSKNGKVKVYTKKYVNGVLYSSVLYEGSSNTRSRKNRLHTSRNKDGISWKRVRQKVRGKDKYLYKVKIFDDNKLVKIIPYKLVYNKVLNKRQSNLQYVVLKDDVTFIDVQNKKREIQKKYVGSIEKSIEKEQKLKPKVQQQILGKYVGYRTSFILSACAYDKDNRSEQLFKRKSINEDRFVSLQECISRMMTKTEKEYLYFKLGSSDIVEGGYTYRVIGKNSNGNWEVIKNEKIDFNSLQ